MSAPRLTAAQRRALHCADANGRVFCSTQRTAKSLRDMGMMVAAMVDGPEGTEPTPSLYSGYITPAGHAALEAGEK